MCEYDILREALYERFINHTTWYVLSQKIGVSISKLRRANESWSAEFPESQPQSPRDIYFRFRSPGRPLLIPAEHAKIIVGSIQYFADNNTPLTRVGVRQLIRTYASMLGEGQRHVIDVGENGPSDHCINNLMERHGLKYMSVKAVEDKRLSAIIPEIVSEHIARVQAAIDRYGIRDPKFIFNRDQTSSSFKRMCGRSLRKGCGSKDTKLKQAIIRTKGQLERVTVMPCVSAAGRALKPVIIFPRVQPHYRKVKGNYQGLHSVLPECYLYYREVPGADSAIVHDWAKQFVEETKNLRANGQHLLLVLDGYSAHIQFTTLNHFRLNRIIVIALPAHSSHRLQPLDVSVFNSYKSFLQSFMHSAAMSKTVLNAFDVGLIISNAYEQSMRSSNIRSGFLKCGIWDSELLGTNGQMLQHLFDASYNTKEVLTVEELVKVFVKEGRSLLRDADVEESGTIKINTKKGAHLTSDKVIDALKVREEKKISAAKKKLLLKEALPKDVREPRKALLHYAELADQRLSQRKRARDTREMRRVRQKTFMARKCP